MDTAGEQADAAVSRLQEYVEQLGIRLQDGWRAEVVTRKEGRSIGTKDTYYYAPDGRRFRSRREVAVQLSLGTCEHVSSGAHVLPSPFGVRLVCRYLNKRLQSHVEWINDAHMSSGVSRQGRKLV